MNLREKAIKVLNDNWRDGFTVPRKALYPFQWNWDSGFTSLGLAHYDVNRAIRELETLFTGQWDNGMIPHIVFHSETENTYFPNHDFWKTTVNNGAPQSPKTSGITQPPVHGFIIEKLLELHPDHEGLIRFVQSIFEQLIDSHRFFYTIRDPEREGLAFIYHPWETGRDNSPLWDESIDRIIIDADQLPAYTRKDTNHAAADERPTSDQYDRYVYLLELGKKYKYDNIDIYQESPCLIQDTLINAILIRSNEALIRVGDRFGFDISEVEEWQAQAVRAFRDKLWNEELGTFTAYDMRAGHQIARKEIGGLTALFAGIPDDDQADLLHSYLKSLVDKSFHICPSFDVDDARYDSKRYWRGPIWPQMNWLVYQGLHRYGYTDTANVVKRDLVEMVDRLGFHEYFEPEKKISQSLSKGYGGDHFSWTAACVLDFLETK